MQKKDPTEDVMAAIARIVEHPSARTGAAGQAAQSAGTQALAAMTDDEAQAPGAHGYSRLGPGPLAALRFKWTARRDAGGDFYVDETIGDYSRPMTSGPMSAEDAIAFVDTQVKDARERFDRLKADISVRGPDQPQPEAKKETSQPIKPE